MPSEALRAGIGLQRLAAMQRPLPLRAWVAAAFDEPATVADPAAAAALLFIAARLLDAPLPPALVARLAALPAELAEPAASAAASGRTAPA